MRQILLELRESQKEIAAGKGKILYSLKDLRWEFKKQGTRREGRVRGGLEKGSRKVRSGR